MAVTTPDLAWTDTISRQVQTSDLTPASFNACMQLARCCSPIFCIHLLPHMNHKIPQVRHGHHYIPSTLHAPCNPDWMPMHNASACTLDPLLRHLRHIFIDQAIIEAKLVSMFHGPHICSDCKASLVQDKLTESIESCWIEQEISSLQQAMSWLSEVSYSDLAMMENCMLSLPQLTIRAKLTGWRWLTCRYGRQRLVNVDKCHAQNSSRRRVD